VAMDAIRRIVQVIRETSRAAEKDVGLTGARLFVLQRLLAGGPATIGELAERTATHQSSVSVVVQRLVDSGLVSRGASADDRRRRVVTLTRRGRAVAERAPELAQERLIAGLAALPATELRRLAASLNRVVVALSPRGRTVPMFFEEPARPPRRRRA